MRQIRISCDLRLRGAGLDGAPARGVVDVPLERIGVRATDYVGIVPSLRVAAGDRIAAGDELFVDRFDDRLRVVAPVAGTIAEIRRGSRRRLQAIVIDVDPDAGLPAGAGVAPDCHDPDAVVLALLEHGLWPALRQRPFERIADPSQRPEWLFVTAIDTRPGAPDVADYLDRHRADFDAGIAVLQRLPTRRTFVCVAPGVDPAVSGDAVEAVAFAGPHPAGLVGTHIGHLASVDRDRVAWHVGYQDVVAIGRLATTGEVDFRREFGVPGTADTAGCIVRALPGAEIAAIAPAVADGRSLQPGSLFDAAGSVSRFLGRYDNQLSALPAHDTENATPVLRWLRIVRDIVAGTIGGRLEPRTAQAGDPAAGLIPLEAFDRVWPFRPPVVPLLRALLAGDQPGAERAGLLALAGEDFALCAAVCPQRIDYVAQCRALLDAMGGDA